jgi:hypothetical protein
MKNNPPSRPSTFGVAFAGFALIGALAAPAAHADTVNASAGGTFTLSFDRNALGAYVFGSTLGNNGYYLANFWDGAASDYSNQANTASSFIASTGSTEISALNLVHNLMPTGPNPTGQATGRHVMGTTAGFSLDTSSLAGVGGEKLGMTGVEGFYLPNYGGGSRIINGDFSLQYDTIRQTNGRSGWYLANNISYTLAVYDLANLNLTRTAGDSTNWQLTGDVWMSPENASMLLGSAYTDVGNFSLGVGSYATPVPVPAAAWLFGSGLMGVFGFARRRQASRETA